MQEGQHTPQEAVSRSCASLPRASFPVIILMLITNRIYIIAFFSLKRNHDGKSGDSALWKTVFSVVFSLSFCYTIFL
jgi:hypothetical protein